MPLIANTALAPNIAPGMHTLLIEGIEVIQQEAYQKPGVMEDRLKVALKTLTEDEPVEVFNAWMSPNLSPGAVFGSIVLAILGETPDSKDFDTDTVVGGVFMSMVGKNDKGWPKLVAGTAGPVRKKGSKAALQTSLTGEAPF